MRRDVERGCVDHGGGTGQRGDVRRKGVEYWTSVDDRAGRGERRGVARACVDDREARGVRRDVERGCVDHG